jgi:hypothetical protein
MTNEEITLPPLPPASRHNGTYESAAFSYYTEEQVRYAQREAVLLDRQQRAAPSAAPPPAAPTGEEEVTRLVRWLTAPLAKGAK